MSNEHIAQVLYEIADYLEVDDMPFKPEAYREAAKFVEHYKEELVAVYKRGGVDALEALPEIGESMARKIAELIETGKLKYLEKMRKKLPVDMVGLNAIAGVGPKTIAKLYKEHKVKTVEDYEKLKVAQPSLKLRRVPAGKAGRRLYAEVKPIAESIVSALRKLPQAKVVEVAGSLRRKTATIGDVDLVAASTRPAKVMEVFASLPEVERVYSKGDTKTLVRLKEGIDADLRVVAPESFGAAMQYFTGPKEHSIATRQYARDRGLKLNEYGLFRGKKKLAGKTEKEIYDVLGIKLEKPGERSGKLTEKRLEER